MAMLIVCLIYDFKFLYIPAHYFTAIILLSPPVCVLLLMHIFVC